MIKITEDMIKRQEELEVKMRGLGIDRYRRDLEKSQINGSEDRTSYGKLLVAKAIEPVAKGIEEWIAAATGKVGRNHVALKYLRMFDPEVAALLAVRAVVRGVTRQDQMLQGVAMTIGTALEEEARMADFKEQDAPNFKRMVKKASKSHHAGHKKRVMSASASRSQVESADWANDVKLHVGIKLVEIIQQHTGWVEVKTMKTRTYIAKKGMATTSYGVLCATADLLAWVKKNTDNAELLAPMFMPMVVPPLDWTTPWDGGYITGAFKRLPIVKTHRKTYLEELSNRANEMPVVYEAINALQATPWVINRPVYEVAQLVWGAGQETAGLPPMEDYDLPIKPSVNLDQREGWSEDEKKTWKGWKYNAAQVHKANIRLRGKRIQTMQTMWIAGQYLDDVAMWFPYQLDFRGRAYTIPAFLSPQGNDLAKGMLTFAEGKPIVTDAAEDWLAIHGANVYGFDKASLKERVAFIKSMNKEIKAIAADPLECLDLWAKADKPWQFLSFCFEWSAYLDQGRGFVSHLPVSMDGTCNGLQIFSLVLRDEIGGRAVNLLPTETPQDIYQVVADKTIEKLKAIGKDDEDYDMAQTWLAFGINRKTTKRPVMVLPYGGKKWGMSDYVGDYISDHSKALGANPFAENSITAKSWLTQYIWTAIGETVIAARECMDWLQAVARIAASKNLPIIWTTPDGLPIFQAYADTTSRRVETTIGDKVYKLTQHTTNPLKVDRTRQANSVAPNWVHSLDGCALRVTVSYAKSKGLTQFAVVHDSYGTVAADAPVLAQELRRAFVDTFTTHDVLAEFKAEVIKLIGPEEGEKLPPLPAKGTLEVSKVLESAFFFA